MFSLKVESYHLYKTKVFNLIIQFPQCLNAFKALAVIWNYEVKLRESQTIFLFGIGSPGSDKKKNTRSWSGNILIRPSVYYLPGERTKTSGENGWILIQKKFNYTEGKVEGEVWWELTKPKTTSPICKHVDDDIWWYLNWESEGGGAKENCSAHPAHLLCHIKVCPYKSLPARIKTLHGWAAHYCGWSQAGKKWNIWSDRFIIQIYLHISILKGVTDIISQHVDHLLFIIINVNIWLMKTPLQCIPP